MTPEEQRIAIAEACGWKCNGHPDQLAATVGWEFAYQFVLTPEAKLVTHNSIPDYLNDLNAMHEAEKVLTSEHVTSYVYSLESMNERWSTPAFATASQRAEAFLRTIDKWEEAKP